jgi:hypothetical protein
MQDGKLVDISGLKGFHSILARWRNDFSQLFSVHGVDDVRNTHSRAISAWAECFEVEIATEKLKKTLITRYWPNPCRLIKAGGSTIRYEIHKLNNSIVNKKEMPEERMESIIAHIYKKGDTTDCINYNDISLLSTTNKILSTIMLSRLTPYSEEIIGGHQCGFQRNRSTTDHIFYFRQIFEKNVNKTKRLSAINRLQESLWFS